MDSKPKNSTLENQNTSDKEIKQLLEVIWEYEPSTNSQERILKVFEILLKEKFEAKNQNFLDKC